MSGDIRITVSPNQFTVQTVGQQVKPLPVGQQGPAGPPGSQDSQQAEIDSTVAPGQPLYLKANGHTDLASAGAIATAKVRGLATIAATATTAASYTSSGQVALGDWSAITGAATLTPGATYFLSAEAGKLTKTAPTETGQLVTVVGVAHSFTTLSLEIEPPILL